MVGYKIMKVSRLLSGEDLVRYGGDFKIYSLMVMEQNLWDAKYVKSM